MAPHLLENIRNRLGNGRPRERDPGDRDEDLGMAAQRVRFTASTPTTIPRIKSHRR